MLKKIALIVAAGNGTRMGSDIPKQFLLLLEKPVVWHSIAAFQNAFEDMEIVLVIPGNQFARAEQVRLSFAIPEKIKLVAGGKTRFESVQNGLKSITEEDAIIFVHDAVRCLVTPALIRRCFEETLEKENAVPGIIPLDSVRMETVDYHEQILRNKVRLIQTPQVFYSGIIKTAFQQDYQECFTDEASVVEKLGIKINLIEGEPGNIKITTPIDLVMAECLLSSKPRIP